MESKILNNTIETDIFTDWLYSLEKSLSSECDIHVDCGECRACCISSYFIHIQADEIKTISRIPKELLFPAIGLPGGNYILGFDKNGHCPMFINNSCSIYKYRPRTCRHFDCRVLAAAEIFEDEEKQLINDQVRRWKFRIVNKEDREKMEAVKYAGKFIIHNEKQFPPGLIPKNAIQKAFMAITIYDIFLEFIIKSEDLDLNKNKGRIIELIVNKYNSFKK